MATTIWSMLCLSTRSTMSFVEPATFTPWMRRTALVGVVVSGHDGDARHERVLRGHASDCQRAQSLPPAPTTSVRGRSHMRCVETSARLFWRMTRKIKRMPPMKNMSMKHETKKHADGKPHVDDP